VQRTPAPDAAGDFSAVRYRVHAELAGRRFEEFPIDVAFSNPLSRLPDRLRGTDLLDFAGIERIELPVLPLEQHVAEKLHGYTRSYGTDSGPSTRPKDLVDIVWVKHSATLNAAALRTALDATFATRSLQALPSVVPPAPAGWRAPYAKLAEAVGLPTDLDHGHSEAAALLNPVLAGKARGIWEHAAGVWIDAVGKQTGSPILTAPGAEEIAIGELQNVASDIQPIRIRTIFLALSNAGNGSATIHRAEAISPGHGPLTARAPRTILAGDTATLELTLAAPVDQTLAAGDRFNVELHYRDEAGGDHRLAFEAQYHGGSWTVAPSSGPLPA